MFGQRRGLDSAGHAVFAGPLLTPRKIDKVFRRLHIELFTFVISNDGSICAARAADALLYGARNYALNARQTGWQLLTSGVLFFLV